MKLCRSGALRFRNSCSISPASRKIAFAERAAVDLDAIEGLGLEVVAALGALHEVKRFRALALFGLFARFALGLPLQARGASRFEKVELVLPEPFVFSLPVHLAQGHLQEEQCKSRFRALSTSARTVVIY